MDKLDTEAREILCGEVDGLMCSSSTTLLRRFYLTDRPFVQDRCVNMIARLFNAPLEDGQSAIGAGTVGSSEAIMLAGLAFKRKWQLERRVAGLPCDKPNMVTGANVQVRPSLLLP